MDTGSVCEFQNPQGYAVEMHFIWLSLGGLGSSPIAIVIS